MPLSLFPLRLRLRKKKKKQFYSQSRKLIYCSRTVPEIEKALAELKRLMAYRDSVGAKDENFRGLGLTSRKNLCLHPEVSKEKKGKIVDARCRDLTSAFACEKGREEPGSVELCSFHEVRTCPLLSSFVSRLFLASLSAFIENERSSDSNALPRHQHCVTPDHRPRCYRNSTTTRQGT